MEGTRPAPTRLAQFSHGESRDEIVKKLGQPVTSTTDADGANCDLYTLHLSGYGDAAKASIAFGEVVADVFTLGIAEAVATPTEALTRNKKTPVWFCYKADALARITPKRLEAEDLASSESPGAHSSKGMPAPVVSSPVGVTPPMPSTVPAPASAAPSTVTE